MSEIRKLAAILAADVVGYSRLAGSDEDRTLARLRALRSDLIDPTIAVHTGRVVKRTGDGTLVEFRSVVDAVRCAIEVQNGMVERNAGVPLERRIEFRVGIHVGDVVEESDGDLMGDGVNIAARLEGICGAGGICLSEDAYRQVRDKIKEEFVDLGEQNLKNIVRPMRAYSLRSGHDSTRADGSTTDAPFPGPSLPDKPSIAVLPFQNMSGDPEQEYFADGIAEDLITELSRVKWFFVIARNSSFTYKGRTVDAKQAGRELGVRYLLEGSVRKVGDRVRITGQLIEAETGRHVWADRFDGWLEDLFELQDRITEAIVGAVEPTLKLAELERMREKPTESLAAYDLCLRALPNINSVITTRKFNDDALGLFYRAIALDPHYSLAKALAAYAYVLRKSQHWSTNEEDSEGIRLAFEALDEHGDHPTTLACAGHALAYLGKRYDASIRAMDRASALGGSSWRVLTSNGWVRNYICDAEAALPSFERGMRLSPVDPEIGFSLSGVATSHLIAERYADALTVGNQAIDASPTWMTCYRVVAFALVELGRIEEARAIGRKMLALSPRFSVALYRSTGTFNDAKFFDRYCGALLKAGVPADA